MRIALINDWFSERMGYSENYLPKALAALGHEVHMITSDAQPYFNSPDYASTYEPFLGPGIVPAGITNLDGYVLHRLPHDRIRGRLRISGLRTVLRSLKPAVVQSFEVYAISALEAAVAQTLLGFHLFFESHIHASVFDEQAILRSRRRRLAWDLYRRSVGAFMSSRAERCYPISVDAAQIVTTWFGIDSSKVSVTSLGVDTDRFHPPDSEASHEERVAIRRSLGFADDDIICIYTGRFAEDKGPRLLAEAIASLASRGEPFRGLFVGMGPNDQVAALARAAGCTVHPFVPADELARLYRAADVGVWPRQESTSQLDAAASGLPIIVSDRAAVRDRIDGNGLTYRDGDPRDLARAIRTLKRGEARERLGSRGRQRMLAEFSWLSIAAKRSEDFAEALDRRKSRLA